MRMRKFFKIFWIFLFLIGGILPLFCVNVSEISDQENRILASFPEVKKEGIFNLNYGKDFENWLNDRFGGRNEFVMLHAGMHYMLEKYYQENNVIKGKKGRLFFKGKKSSTNLSVETIHSLNKIKEFCDENNIQLFVILAPQSLDIYTEDYPYPFDNSLNDLTINFLNHTNISIILPEENSKKEKDNHKLFFKKDHHWTDDGALIAYRDFVNVLRKSYPDFPEYNDQDFDISFIPQEEYQREGSSINSFCKRLGINNTIFCPSEKYAYYKYKGKIRQRAIKGPQKWGIYKYTNEKGFPLKIMLMSHSLGASFEVFLNSYVKDVITIDTNGYHKFLEGNRPSMKPYLPLIKENKPDLLIILFSSEELKNFF